MAHTNGTKHGNNKIMRRTLRREVPSTVGLLADEEDFASMTEYRTFTFDNHTAYLQQVEGLLRALAAQGVHTTVALFDPEEFLEFCEAIGLDPDTAESRTRFTAEVAVRGTSVPYTGQPIDHLVPQLISEAVRQATWDYATLLLARLGDCAECGQGIGREAFDRASRLVARILEEAGPGSHHLVCSVPAEEEQLIAVLHAERAPGEPAHVTDTEGAEFVTVLAAGIAVESPGGVVLRTTRAGAPDQLHGWRLHRGHLIALTAGEVFNAYCTDAATGDPLAPEPDVEYCAGFDIEEPDIHR
ncbi:hypothetical protein J7I98_03195 [Streptomyces sp. ISL-98]|uniref:hypothetical protein n=1 Tax=Streptomyces sp. ISL-98 TaxID=2819192 RepID=UPI001BEC45A7|nr:hypothetical protein [Streptomyces sp. ISL-98]MBT2504918.1 hypothetical protein [Streptomyces sp. ISL-98]